MRTTAGSGLTSKYQQTIVNAFRAESALSGPSARRLRDLGIKDTQVLRELITKDVIRKAGPERYFLDEGVWAARHVAPAWQLVLVVIGVLLAAGLGAAWLNTR